MKLSLIGRFVPAMISSLLFCSPLSAVEYHQHLDSLSVSTADHSKFKQLQKDFKSGPEVTKACLECHTEASKQVHRTKHWTWEVPMKDGKMLGKRHVVNNFCISVEGNEPRCTSCHVGYDWKDNSFDFASQENVDCLVCHDGTGTYKNYRPALATRLTRIRSSVAKPGQRSIWLTWRKISRTPTATTAASATSRGAAQMR